MKDDLTKTLLGIAKASAGIKCTGQFTDMELHLLGMAVAVKIDRAVRDGNDEDSVIWHKLANKIILMQDDDYKGDD